MGTMTHALVPLSSALVPVSVALVPVSSASRPLNALPVAVTSSTVHGQGGDGGGTSCMVTNFGHPPVTVAGAMCPVIFAPAQLIAALVAMTSSVVKVSSPLVAVGEYVVAVTSVLRKSERRGGGGRVTVGESELSVGASEAHRW
jgi:hypothetical protein